jgi:hypothetical protein
MKMYLLETRKNLIVFFGKAYEENKRTRYFKDDFEAHGAIHCRLGKDKTKKKG